MFVHQQWREEFSHILLHDCGFGLQQETGEIFIQVVFTTQVSNSLIQDVIHVTDNNNNNNNNNNNDDDDDDDDDDDKHLYRAKFHVNMIKCA